MPLNDFRDNSVNFETISKAYKDSFASHRDTSKLRKTTFKRFRDTSTTCRDTFLMFRAIFRFYEGSSMPCRDSSKAYISSSKLPGEPLGSVTYKGLIFNYIFPS